MPHKKNPDVFELIRSHCNRIKSLPNEIMMMTTNLPSGYHRDLQLLKEHLFPALQTLKHCLQMAQMMLSAIEVRKDIMADEKYRYAFSVEEVNRLVLKGIPFRDAYQQIGAAIEGGEFKAGASELKHTHEGSIGNLCNKEIRSMMEQALQGFHFEKTEQAVQKLLNH